MSEDVGTTKRKPLTPTQRLRLFEEHKGICGICGLKIEAGAVWIDEHIRPLGLGGSNDMDNRAPVHKACADKKTFGADGDNAKIAKAKRQKMRHLGIRRATPKIPSRPFPSSGKEPRIKKNALPPRRIFKD